MKELSEKDIEDYKIYIQDYYNGWNPYIFLISRFHNISEDEIRSLPMSYVFSLFKEIEIWVNNNYKDGKRIKKNENQRISRWKLLDLD